MENYHIKHIADAIKVYRAKHKLSQSDLSKLTGISRVSIGQIEREETNPTIDTINIIFSKMGYHFVTINIS